MTTARWTPTAAEVRRAVAAARRSAPFPVRYAAQLGALVLLVVILGLLLLARLVLDRFVGSALAAPVALLVIGSWFQDRGIWWSNVYVRQPVEATLTDDELRHTGTGAVRFASSWPWTAFRYAVESPDQFVLVGAKEKTGFVPYVPKRALDNPAAVREFLAGRMPVRALGV